MGVRTLTVRYAKTGAGSIWINRKDVALSKQLSRVPLHGAGGGPSQRARRAVVTNAAVEVFGSGMP